MMQETPILLPRNRLVTIIISKSFQDAVFYVCYASIIFIVWKLNLQKATTSFYLDSSSSIHDALASVLSRIGDPINYWSVDSIVIHQAPLYPIKNLRFIRFFSNG
ncbi:hypothetical protein BDQ12DRAFT_216948 [Crucibulum laeve]|uniref:Uncharacterized protein n=1 Tax=Crucibulum laeve TaxID=68775 RepID=A0A5C3LWV1_9AGAR|nr:hypothetical protein BDQ12DRAFT_216948 [Crucibulum laeve]